MKMTLMLAAASAALTVLAKPSIDPSSVTLTQDSGSGLVTIAYTLAEGEAAIVTAEILTNGVSIGEEPLTNMTGAVNRKVQPGSQTIQWKPTRTWPGFVFGNGECTARLTAWSLQTPPDYMVVHLTEETDNVRFYATSNGVPGGVTAEINKTSRLVLRKVHAAAKSYLQQFPIRTQRTAAFSDDYYVGVFELTQGQYVSLGFENPSRYTGADRLTHPVEGLPFKTLRGAYDWPEKNHDDVTAESYIGVLRRHAGGIKFDALTEAQWEFACKAGPEMPYSWGKDISQASHYAWFSKAGDDETTQEVGLKWPGAWGLYDMHGNVMEHTLDRCVDSTAPDSIETLPAGYYIDPYSWPKSHSTCCTMKGGKYQQTVTPAYQRNRVAVTGGFIGNGHRLGCPALIP